MHNRRPLQNIRRRGPPRPHGNLSRQQPQQQYTPQYVVYFIDNQSRTTWEIKDIIRQTPRGLVHLQDVRHLQQIPTWLTGTPMFADIKAGKAYKGTDAMNQLRRLVVAPTKQVTPPPRTATMPRAATDPISCNQLTPSLFQLPTDTYISPTISSSKLNESSIQAYMQKRQKLSMSQPR
jgi:hypothetical protein